LFRSNYFYLFIISAEYSSVKMAQQNDSIFNIYAKPGGSEIAIQTLQADNETIKDEFMVRCELGSKPCS